jgi:hypothetical protein
VVLVLFDLNSKFILKWFWKKIYKRKEKSELTTLPVARWPGGPLEPNRAGVLLLFLTVGLSEPSSPFLPLFTASAWAEPERSSGRTSLSSESLTGGTPLSAASSSLPS